MRVFTMILASALGGALLAVALVYAMASSGMMPINDRQMQTYLMLHPDLAMAMMGRYQTLEDEKERAEKAAAMKRVDPAAFFNPAIAFLAGPANAKKTLVEFYDYNCPYCRQSLPAVMKYIASHPDTRVSFIEFPIKGEASNIAARAALASRLQPERFLPFHYILMSEKDLVDEQIIYADAVKAGLNLAKLKADMQRPEIAKAVDDSHALAKKAGINATPSFVLNGKLHEGAVDDAELAALLKS